MSGLGRKAQEVFGPSTVNWHHMIPAQAVRRSFQGLGTQDFVLSCGLSLLIPLSRALKPKSPKNPCASHLAQVTLRPKGRTLKH